MDTTPYYIALTECINTREFAAADSVFATLEEAKAWIRENQASGSYRSHPFSKIIEVTGKDITQIYTKTPDYSGWCEQY